MADITKNILSKVVKGRSGVNIRGLVPKGTMPPIPKGAPIKVPTGLNTKIITPKDNIPRNLIRKK